MVLHRRPFRENSQIIECFTREHGRMAFMLKSGRSRKGSLTDLVQPFQPLLLLWRGQGELPLLSHAEADGPPILLQGTALKCAFYLNELLLYLTQRDDPHPEIYTIYVQTLTLLHEGSSLEWTLRLFERDLLEALGYGIECGCEAELGRELESELVYSYHPEQGAVVDHGQAPASVKVHGQTLLALHQGVCENERVRQESKQLLRFILQHHLGNRRLKSRELFKQVY